MFISHFLLNLRAVPRGPLPTATASPVLTTIEIRSARMPVGSSDVPPEDGQEVLFEQIGDIRSNAIRFDPKKDREALP